MRGYFELVCVTLLLKAFIREVSSMKKVDRHSKLEREHDKFILASTAVGGIGGGEVDEGWLRNLGLLESSPEILKKLRECIPLNLPVPESYDPLPLCLKQQDLRKMAIHKNFRLSVDQVGEPSKEMTLKDLMKHNRNLEGFVVGKGISYVRGYIRDGNFYGTVAYRHLIRSQMMMCSVVPTELLEEFIDLKNMDEDEKEEFVERRTVKNIRGIPPNAIVTCGDMHREDDDDVENPFLFHGKGNPTNVAAMMHGEPSTKRHSRGKRAPLPKPQELAPVAPDPTAIPMPAAETPTAAAGPASDQGVAPTVPTPVEAATAGAASVEAATAGTGGLEAATAGAGGLEAATAGTGGLEAATAGTGGLEAATAGMGGLEAATAGTASPGTAGVETPAVPGGEPPLSYTTNPSVALGSTTPSQKILMHRDILNRRTYKNFFNPAKKGTYFASVCYLVDNTYVRRRFNGSYEDLTLLLAGYVDLTDWILRATDWNMDGIPDNIGIKLVDVKIYNEAMKGPEDKWGRQEGGNFSLRIMGGKFLASGGGHLLQQCDIRTGIGEVNVAKYGLMNHGGCTACESKRLTSFLNPYVEKFSPRGEYIRMLYKQIRILSLSMVYTKSICTNCTDTAPRSKKDIIAGMFDRGDDNWGACIVEGDIQSRSNIPLNSFRMSVCSVREGQRCLQHLSTITECMEYQVEESYCGNGIVEGDEECDCGTLATCAETQCTCSPRSGVDPCRKLTGPDTQICFTLIKCRGFRFLYELGLSNNSHFMQGLPDVIDRARQRNVDNGKSDSESFLCPHCDEPSGRRFIILAIITFGIRIIQNDH